MCDGDDGDGDGEGEEEEEEIFSNFPSTTARKIPKASTHPVIFTQTVCTYFQQFIQVILKLDFC